jgi:hypothetical protein
VKGIKYNVTLNRRQETHNFWRLQDYHLLTLNTGTYYVENFTGIKIQNRLKKKTEFGQTLLIIVYAVRYMNFVMSDNQGGFQTNMNGSRD